MSLPFCSNDSDVWQMHTFREVYVRSGCRWTSLPFSNENVARFVG